MGDPGLLLGGGGLPRLKGEFARRRIGESTRRRTGESSPRLGDPLRPIGDLCGGEAGFRRGDNSCCRFFPSFSTSTGTLSVLGASLLEEVATAFGGEAAFFRSGRVNLA